MIYVLVTDSSNPNPGKIIEVTFEGVVKIKAQDNAGNVVEFDLSITNPADLPQVGQGIEVPRKVDVSNLSDLSDYSDRVLLDC